MTLILTVNGQEAIWLLADRRLSYKGRPPKDDARKVMLLETSDGVAILGYAGLGATALGTEPADWMSAVLRGRNLPLERSLSVLVEALRKQFPRHMVQMPSGKDDGPSHNVVITAFVDNKPMLYTIDLLLTPDRKSFGFRHTRHVVGRRGVATQETPRLAIAGSGLSYLIRDKKWMRRLLRIVKAHDRGQASLIAVADELARLNSEVYRGTADASVGPRSIVVWRHRKDGRYKGGGSHRFYTEAVCEPNSPALPTITTGTDMAAVANLLMPHAMKMFEKMKKGQETNKDEINAELNSEFDRLPKEPDEKLR